MNDQSVPPIYTRGIKDIRRQLTNALLESKRASHEVDCESDRIRSNRDLEQQLGGSTMMRKSVLAIVMGALVATVLLGFVSPAEAQQCSEERSAGYYAFTLTGVVILPTGPVPIAGVGTATLDSTGKVTGTESRSVGGDFADETLTGTYTVNSNCAGTATLQFYESGQLVRTSILSLIFDQDEQSFRMVQQSLELPNGAFLPIVATV